MSVDWRPHVLCVAGARPNFPKVKPILDALERRDCATTFVHSGQHYDDALSAALLADVGLRPPDHVLVTGSGAHGAQTARIMIEFEPVVEALRPDVIVVVGDVNSTLACALVGAKSGCLVAHVEAGLRSRDRTMPEEINRIVTDRLSDHLFAPSPDAVENLLAEGFGDDQVHLVGNVMIDTLLTNRERARRRLPALRAAFGLGEGRFGVATLHRPSNVDDPRRLGVLLGALAGLSDEVPIVLPVHPRAAAAFGRLAAQLPPTLRLVEPVGYLDFLALESAAAVVLTDSGGVQEETTVLGVPCLTLRESTERPITIDEGTNELVGLDPERIVAAGRRILRDGIEPRRPVLWDGHAGDRVADVLVTCAPPTRAGRR